MKPPRFWPLDTEPEAEVYELLGWDLPGVRRQQAKPRRKGKSKR